MRTMLVLFALIGATFSAPAPTPTPNACTTKIYVATSNGTGSGLVISSDLGHTWSARDPAPGSQIIYSIYALDSQVYVGTYTGVAASKNGGHTWTFRDLSANFGSHMGMVTSVFATDKKALGSIYSCAKPGYTSDCGKVTLSNDGGQSWAVDLTLPYPLYYGPTSSVYAVADRSFVGVNNPDFGGLAVTDDGSTWRVVDSAHGLGSNLVTAISGESQNIYVGLDRDGGTISISEDGGDSWGIQNTTKLGLGNGVLSVFANGGQVYVGTKGGGLSISKSVWDSWTVKTTGNGLVSDVISAVTAVGNTVVVGTPAGLSISTDGGQTWVTKTTHDGLPHNNVTAVFAHCV